MVAAGPMMVSGLHEALLDYRVLHSIERTCTGRLKDTPLIRTYELSPNQQAELLIAIACGNLDPTINDPQSHLNESVGLPKDPFSNVHAAAENQEAKASLIRTQTRLESLLRTQYSFGSIVGAPVLFYLGSFIYNVALLSGTKGDNATAHALAFGQWWMCLVHVAIITGCLLAANNPSTGTAIVGLQSGELPGGPYEAVYPGRHQPVPMWRRGICKYKWIKNTQACTDIIHQNWWPLKVRMENSWITLASMAFILVLIPSTLGFMVSFNTPRVGLSCRSMTFLIYTCTQALLIVVTTIDANREGALYDDMFKLCSRATWADGFLLHHLRTILLAFITIVALLGALFTACAGTLMQLMGVYQNCLCSIPIAYWRHPDNQSFSVSTDTALARASIKYWTGCGWAAICFMAIVCYVGWWYQRYLRDRYHRQVERLDITRKSELFELHEVSETTTLANGASYRIDGHTMPP